MPLIYIRLFGIFVACAGAYGFYKERKHSSWQERAMFIALVIAGLILSCSVGLEHPVKSLPNNIFAFHANADLLWGSPFLLARVDRRFFERGNGGGNNGNSSQPHMGELLIAVGAVLLITSNSIGNSLGMIFGSEFFGLGMLGIGIQLVNEQKVTYRLSWWMWVGIALAGFSIFIMSVAAHCC